MKNVLVLIFVLVLGKKSFSVGELINQDDQLVGVAVCFRHGDRSPIGSYPNDPYHDLKYWPDGFGQLLDKGKANQFELGTWLRTRYSNFLSERYSLNEIYVRSTDVDRAITSAASNLAGLYYPRNRSEAKFWPKILPWNPIPIHTVPEDDDEIVYMKKKCENYEKLYRQTLTSDYLKNILKEHENITKLVESKTGWNITDITTFQGLSSVFYVYQQHNASYIPAWANELDLDELRYLAGVSQSVETFTLQLRRYKVGPFFDYFNNYLDGILDGTKHKFLMLSAHDGTLTSILNSYGAYDNHIPEFCAMIIWELYKTTDGGAYLKIFYRRNVETEALEEVRVGNCSGACPYSQYKRSIEDITVDSSTWKTECNGNINL